MNIDAMRNALNSARTRATGCSRHAERRQLTDDEASILEEWVVHWGECLRRGNDAGAKHSIEEVSGFCPDASRIMESETPALKILCRDARAEVAQAWIETDEE